MISKRIIRDMEGEPYLVRWNWRPCRWFSIKLHRILKADPGRDLHDHPWWFCSFVLWGSYDEEVVDPDSFHTEPGRIVFGKGTKIRRVRWFNFKRAQGLHRIIRVSPSTWTLVINGPRVRQWGFQTGRGWVPWHIYHNVRFESYDTQLDAREGHFCDHPIGCVELLPDRRWGCGWCADLSDLFMIMHNVSLVYQHVTGGRISKPNTLAEAVIAEADDRCTEAIDAVLEDIE